MGTARYWIGVLLVVSMPPAILWWFVVHPFIGFWRRVGRAPHHAPLTNSNSSSSRRGR